MRTSPTTFLIAWLAFCQFCIGAGTWNGVAATAWNGVAATAWNGTSISFGGGGGFDTTNLVVWLDLANDALDKHTSDGTSSATLLGTGPSYTTGPFADANGALTTARTGTTSWAHIPGATILDPSGDMSIVFWFKDLDSTTGTRYMVSRYIGTGNFKSWFLSRQTSTNDRVVFRISDDGTNHEEKAFGTGEYPGDDSAWHHYAITYNNGTEVAKFYVDGTYKSSVTFTTETGPLYGIGTNYSLCLASLTNSNAADALDGAMARFSLWHRALSDAEITTLYNSGGDVKYADLSGL